MKILDGNAQNLNAIDIKSVLIVLIQSALLKLLKKSKMNKLNKNLKFNMK